MAQTVQKRKRFQQNDGDDGDDNNNASVPTKRPQKSTARKSTGGGPPVASSSRDKGPSPSLHPSSRHLTRSRPIRCQRTVWSTQETPLPSRHPRTSRNSQVPAQHRPPPPQTPILSRRTPPFRVFFLPLTFRVEYTGPRDRIGYDDRHQLSDG